MGDFMDLMECILDMPVDRYDRTFCDSLMQVSKEGYSPIVWAGSLGIPANMIDKWRARFPEFDRACEMAEVYRKAFIEKRLINTMVGQESCNTRLLELVSKNVLGWSDRVKNENSGTQEIVITTSIGKRSEPQKEMTIKEIEDAVK
jgi:hypothetical protein